MPRENVNRRASETRSDLDKVRRRYKLDTRKRKKILPGEQEHVENMVIVLKLAGYTKTQISRTVGVSVKQVREMLEKPDVADRLIALRAALPAAALDLLQGYSIEAVQAILYVMRSSEDETVILKAAAEILDRSGVAKASRSERHQINEDRTTISDDGLLEKLRTAPVHVQEQAAKLIEGLENLLVEASQTGETVEPGK